MAQQHAADVYPDELCRPNKRYDLMDANKKVDLKQVQCLPESKILTNIIKNHPLRFSIADSSSVPWIYLAQFWHTLKEDGSKYRLTFMLDKKVLSLTLDDFRIIFYLPQANDNNHDSFMPPPSFLDMLLWEGLYYSLHHATSLIPYPRFIKIIISHYMTCFPDISRRARDMYHNLQDDDIMKNIFNSGRHKDKVGMQIPDWMITEEMKHTKHYRMYAEVFGLDVPLTQSQPTESTQGTHRTPSAPRSPNPKMDTTESSAPKRSTVIRFCLPERRSTCLTPPAPVPTVDKADEMILQDTLQVSLAEHKSREEKKARENVELVNKHLASKEIEKMMERSKNVIDDSLSPRNDEPNILGTRLEPRSDKESPKMEITNDKEVEITNVVIPVNVNEEEEELTDEVYALNRREKGKIVEESRSTPFPTPIRSPRIHTDLVSLDTEKLQEMTVTDTKTTPSSRSPSTNLSKTNQLLSLFKAKPARFKRYKNSFQELQGCYTYLFEHLKARFLSRKSFDTLADHLQEVMVESLPTMVDTHIKEQVKKQVPEQDDPHDDAHLEGENSNQEQVDDYDFWTDSYASDDDEIPTKQVSQDIMQEVSLTIDEAKLKKMVDEMLRQRCTSGDEHQYHIDQMKNFLKSDIVWERPEKIVLSLHKFPAIIFNDDDIEERTFRWVNKCVKKFNPYARYGVEHWKNPHAKIFYIKKQKEPGKPKEEIVTRRANECIVSITELNYKNLNKNDIEDMYLLIMNGKVSDYAETELLCYQQKVNLTAPAISFPGVEKHKIVLEGLKSYNNDVKYGYIQRELTNDEVEYLKLFKEEIEVRLKYRNQMRR
ncbi:hypothetical protein Tco_0286108 [Tanacetum coccineum]